MATRRDEGIVPAGPAPPQPPNHQLTPPPPPSPLNDGDHQSDADSEWFDVMIVGHTGQGKSTTADKMILAYYKPPPDSSSSPSPDHSEEMPDDVIDLEPEEDFKGVTSPDEDEQSDTKACRRRTVQTDSGVVEGLTINDFTVWTASTVSEIDKDPIRDYLKLLEVSGSLQSPHLEVNTYRKDQKTSRLTKSCQLVSNDVTKTRVLDVPGFFTGEDSGDDSSDESDDESAQTCLEKESESCAQSHLTLMREIIRIQYVMKIKFNRILYFLPVRGPLNRPYRVLKQELLTLARYFGRSIFDIMVIVATVQSRFSEMPHMQSSLFTDEDRKSTMKRFYKTMKEVLSISGKEAFPKPPLLFISLLDRCEDIVSLVRSAEVTGDPLELSFDQSTCARCSSSIKEIEREMILCLPRSQKKVSRDDIAFVQYGKSNCHPLLVPEGSELQDIEVVHGVVCIVLKKGHRGQRKEVCHNCGESPGEDGCMTVGSKYDIEIKDKKVVILVDHTNWIEKHRRLSHIAANGNGDEANEPKNN